MYFSEQKIHTFLSLPGYLSITEGKNEDLHTYYTISEPSVVFITIYVLSKPSFSHLAYFRIIRSFFSHIFYKNSFALLKYKYIP